MDAERASTERAAFRALLLAHSRLTDRVEADLAGAGLPPIGWYDVLNAVSESGSCGMRMFELADVTAMSRSGMTRLIDRLEADGMIQRRDCPSDRRGQVVVATERGIATLEDMCPAYGAAIHRHFGSHPIDVAALARELGALADAHAPTPVPARAPEAYAALSSTAEPVTIAVSAATTTGSNAVPDSSWSSASARSTGHASR
jgi:DNA-binding MarR family transcriptional regulator